MVEPDEIDRAALLRWGLAIFVFALDCASPPDAIFPVFYVVVLVIGKQTNIYGIWALALVSMAFSLISPMLSVPPAPGCPDRVYWLNRLLVLIAIVITALLVHQRADYRK